VNLSMGSFALAVAVSITASRDRGGDSDPTLVNAMVAVQKAVPIASADLERPTYHFHPPANWNNDPNGTLFYKGWHHLFYQLNPFGTSLAHQHWGHARSKDLVNWEHLPIGVTRRCWCGCWWDSLLRLHSPKVRSYGFT
jgi:hypothetical protein